MMKINMKMKQRWLFFPVFLILVALFKNISANVVNLTISNFDELVMASDDVWFVNFFASDCKPCVEFKKTYDKFASVVKGIVKVGAINAKEEWALTTRFSVEKFPNVLIFNVNKNEPEMYKLERTVTHLVRVASEVIRGRLQQYLDDNDDEKKPKISNKKQEPDGYELTDSNFEELVLKSKDPWLVGFFSPHCGHCRRMANDWVKAATGLKGKVKLGSVNVLTNSRLVADFKIDSYPTIKYFPSGKKTKKSFEPYTGGRSESDIISWCLDRYDEDIHPPEVLELTNKNIWDECKEKALCVITILPDLLDCQSQCRNGYLKIIKEMSMKFKKQRLGWIWATALSQSKIEDAFGIGGFGYPALTVVNYKKMKYTLFKGSFSKNSIDEFLRNIFIGKGETISIQKNSVLKIVNLTPWDGKDGKPIVEEDIDLSNVEMDEKSDKEEL